MNGQARAIGKPLAGPVLALLVGGLIVSGCAGRKVVAPTEPLVEAPAAGEMLANLGARRAQVRALRAIARLRYRSPEAKQNARHVLAVERPNSVRIEVLSMFGTVFALTASEGRLQVYVPDESTFYAGPASPANLARYLPGGLAVPEIVDHLLATPPFAELPPPSVELVDRRIQLSQPTVDGSHVAWFADPHTPIAYRKLDRDGAVIFEARYDDVELVGGIAVAKKITLAVPATAESLEVSMKDPETNPPLPDSYFSLTPPPDSKRIEL